MIDLLQRSPDVSKANVKRNSTILVILGIFGLAQITKKEEKKKKSILLVAVSRVSEQYSVHPILVI